MEDCNELKKFNLILQGVLLNWDSISIDPDYTHILDPKRNSMYDKFREMNLEETDKMIKARCMAFSVYLLVSISACQ
jgi:hypothetical protein